MADFTLNRTIEDQDNEQYELSFDVNDIPELESETAMGRAFLEWEALFKEWFQAPDANEFRTAIERNASLSNQLYRVQCSVGGTEFAIDDTAREALRSIGIVEKLDLTAHRLNNRSFATFLFFANSVATPTYQRISEISHSVQREYARLAFPVSGTREPVVYFMIRNLAPREIVLDKLREISQ